MGKIGRDLESFGGDLREEDMGQGERAAGVWEMGKRDGGKWGLGHSLRVL